MEIQTSNNYILDQLPLNEEEISILMENGFDDLESLKLVDAEQLYQLGLDQPQTVYDAIQMLLQEPPQEESHFEDYKLDQENINVFNSPDVKQKPITLKMILASVQNQSKNSKPLSMIQQEQQLTKLTHLHMNNKKVDKIDCLDTCPNLKVLYLFDNLITQLEGMSKLRHLIQLSLYNNRITKMQGFEGLVSLRKLYLEKNMIARMEGLTQCRQLEELYLSDQQHEQAEFTFDEYSLAAVSNSLKYLDVANCQVKNTQSLYYLENLDTLILKRNQIADFDGQVVPFLQTITGLRLLDLTENPVTAIPKYRDQVVLLTRNLQELDNKKITSQERTYLMQLVQRKQLKGQQQPVVKKAQAKPKAFEVQGKNKILHTPNEMGKENDQFYDEEEFYPGLDDQKFVPQGMKGQVVNNQVYLKKRSMNLNSNTDFTTVGQSHQPTKHMPKMMMKKY